MLRRNQSYVVTELGDFPGEVVRARAGLHADAAAWYIGKILHDLTPRKTLLQLLVTLGIEPYQMERALCQVEPHGRNIHLHLLLFSD